MEPRYEAGLVEQYVNEIRALAVRAQSGETVDSSIRSVVAKAASHLSKLPSTTAAENFAAFAGQLKLGASIAHESQPEFKRAMTFAATLVPAKTEG